MWQVDAAPFTIPIGNSRRIEPLGCLDDYRYIVEREDPRCSKVNIIDPARITFTEPVHPGHVRPPEREPELVPLGGRAWRTLWQERETIPDWLWESCKGPNFSQFYFDGMEIFNEHNVYCWAFLRRRGKTVYWGFCVSDYNWGTFFPAIALRPGR